MRRLRFAFALAVGAVAFAGGPAHAQNYPSKSVRIIAPLLALYLICSTSISLPALS